MKLLYSYNLDIDEVLNLDFKGLYEENRRDSVFAAAFTMGEKIIALRDHFGNIPLYYRQKSGSYLFSSKLIDLIEPTDSLERSGLLNYIGFQSAKILSPFKEIKLVEPGSVIEIDKHTGRTTLLYLYDVKPKKGLYESKNKIIEQFGCFFEQSIKRTIQGNDVGLYLSGGIDSSLIAHYLLKSGVNLTCYTSIIGEKDKHHHQSKEICKFLNISDHVVDKVCFKTSDQLLNQVHFLNAGPGGTTASLSLVSMWNNTDINKCSQLYFGQNLDTLFMGMGNQFRTYFASILPKFLSKRIKYKYYDAYYGMSSPSIMHNYLNFRSNGYVKSNLFTSKLFSRNKYSKAQKLILAGLYCGHTPADGDAFIMPSVHNGSLVSNPYYDVDFAEFIMGIPIKYKVKFKFTKRTIIDPLGSLKIHKKLYFDFAKTIFPDYITYPKKSFILPDFDLVLDNLNKSLPRDYRGIKLNNIQSRVAVKIFQNFLNE